MNQRLHQLGQGFRLRGAQRQSPADMMQNALIHGFCSRRIASSFCNNTGTSS